MSVGYFHHITVSGLLEHMTEFIDTHIDMLYSNASSVLACYCAENQIDCFISQDSMTGHLSCAPIASDSLYWINGFLSPDLIRDNFTRSIKVTQTLPAPYAFQCFTTGCDFQPEVRFLSSYYPHLLFEHYMSSDSIDGFYLYVIQQGTILDKIEVWDTPTGEWRDDYPTTLRRDYPRDGSPSRLQVSIKSFMGKTNIYL